MTLRTTLESTHIMIIDLVMNLCIMFTMVHLSSCIWFSMTYSTDPNVASYLHNVHSTFSGIGFVQTSSLENYVLAMYWVRRIYLHACFFVGYWE